MRKLRFSAIGLLGCLSLLPARVAHATFAYQGPSLQGPGLQGPGLQGPGLQGPGLQGPGLQGPGLQGPSLQGPGLQGPGLQGPGLQGPGLQGPGLQGPGLQGPGLQGPGLQGPGLQGPGSLSLGTQAQFPASALGLYVGAFDSSNNYQAAYWEAGKSWIQFINEPQFADEAHTVIVPGTQPAWFEGPNGLEEERSYYDRYVFRNGRIVLQSANCASGVCGEYIDVVYDASTADLGGVRLRGYLMSENMYISVVIKVSAAMVDWTTTTIPPHDPQNYMTAPPAYGSLVTGENTDAAYSVNYDLTDHLRYNLSIFAATSSDGSDASWRSLCGNNPTANSEGLDADGKEDIFVSNFGVVFEGTFNHYNGDWTPEGLSYSCDGGTAAKAMRVFGYQPWNSFSDAIPEPQVVPFGLQAWTASTRGLMADYCENNRGLTVWGTFVDLFDFHNLNRKAYTDSMEYDGGTEYMFGYESAFGTNPTFQTANIDCTGNADGSPLPAGCGGIQDFRGANGDVVWVGQMRYAAMAAYATCQPTGFAIPGSFNSENPNSPWATIKKSSIEVRSTTVCGQGLDTIGPAKSADCGYCTAWELQTTDAQGTPISDGHCLNSTIPGHYWDSVCADYADGDGFNDLPRCVQERNANATVAFHAVPAPAPSKPTAVSATPGNAQATLSWTGSTAAASYKVYKKMTADPGPYELVASDVTDMSFIATGLSNGTTYYFFVTAVNEGGESDYSDPAAQVTPVAPPPAAPATVSAAAGAAGIINLSWSAGANADSYAIWRATALTGTYAQVGTSSSLGFTDVGLGNATAYWYKIKSVNTTGTSALSTAYATATTIMPAPATLTLTPTTSGINLSWTAVTGATAYTVKRGTAATGPYTNFAPSPVTATTYVSTGLTANTTYYYRVFATKGSVNSADSTQQSSMMLLDAPTGLTVVAQSGQTQVSWAAVPGAAKYALFRGTTQVGGTNLTATTFKDTGLTNGTALSYTIKSVNSAGVASAASAAVAATPAVGTNRITATLVPTCSTTVNASFACNYGNDASTTTAWEPAAASYANATWTVDLGAAYAVTTKSTNQVTLSVKCATANNLGSVSTSADNVTWTTPVTFACTTAQASVNVTVNALGGRYVRVKNTSSATKIDLYNVQAFTN